MYIRVPAVAVIAIVEYCNVDVDNVAFLELGSLARDSMAYNLVDGRAHALWEATVVERRWVASPLDGFLVHNCKFFARMVTASLPYTQG